MIKYYLTPEAVAVGCRFDPPRYGDAGYDLYSAETVRVFGHHSYLVSTGLHLQIPDGLVGVIKDRSSMALKKDSHVLAGVIDPSYRGEVKVLLHNYEYSIDIKQGDRIAQMIIVEYTMHDTVSMDAIEDLTLTHRGFGGFGSTGK